MFIARSVFWLTAAFVVMAPSAGMDIGSSARTTGEHLVSQGAQTVASHLAETCTSIECAVGRGLIENAIPAPHASQQAPETVLVGDATAPIPPRRPNWAY